MPRTAPTIDGAPNRFDVTYRFRDREGDRRAFQLTLPAAPTNADLEELANQLGLSSNAVLYEVRVTSRYVGSDSVINATDAVRVSVDDIVNIQYADVLGVSFRGIVPAPIEAMFVVNSEEIDTGSVAFTGVNSALLAVAPAGFTARGVRFTERREINEQQPL